jgi:hypothetical protein
MEKKERNRGSYWERELKSHTASGPANEQEGSWLTTPHISKAKNIAPTILISRMIPTNAKRTPYLSRWEGWDVM